MTEARQPDSDPEPEHGEHEHVHEPHEHYGVLPPDGVEDLTDKLTGYINEIELGGLSDIIGQVLDDFLDQCGGMPQDLMAGDAFEQISRNQLAVTLAYQLGRLEGRSPQLVDNLVARAVESFGFLPVDESGEITDDDLGNPKVQVYPRMRRMEYVQPQILQIQGLGDTLGAGDGGPASE
jgi:hypothetical protein